MHKVNFGNVTTITEFIYNADDNGDNEVGGELNFSALTSLEKVNLSFSKLNSLDFINTLPNSIIAIGCPRNDFYQMELPTTFPTLTNLALINISNSGIKGTIPNLSHLTSLKTLQLEGNTTNEYVTGWREHLKNRHSISTSYTGLTAVASDFALPATITTIDLRYNGLSAAEVTKVLEACVAQTSFTSGTVDVRFQLNGGDSLDSAGSTAKDTLVARGITVNFGGTQ
tara:strand:+ start:60 stop:740 length:681 start_codon:yes stop_codon:yes gene_type:complete